MATRMAPSQGRENDPIIVDAGTEDQTVPACLISSRDVTSTTLDHADGVATRRCECFRRHHGCFSKGEHPTETSSTPTSSHAARFDACSVLMDHAHGVASQGGGCFFKGEHPTKTSASPTSRHASSSEICPVVMDVHHADLVSYQRGGCFCLQHRGGVFKAEHPTPSSHTTSHDAGFDNVRPIMMERGGGCFRPHQHHGGFIKRKVHTTNSSSPTSSHPARFDVSPVVLDRADCGASTQRSTMHSIFVGNSFLRSLLVSGIGRFKAGILLILLIASFAGTASGRPLYYNSPAVCPVVLEQTSVLSHGHVCQTRVFTKAMTSVDPAAPPTSPISGNVNSACRYTADALSILGCLTPWYSILNSQQTHGLHIKLFRWRMEHLKIWKYMAVSSIFYYMTVMMYGLSLPDLSEKLNIFITNCICGAIFVVLLVFLLSRHKTFYQVTCRGVAAGGAGCIAALAFTVPLHKACAKLISENPAIQENIFGILAFILMIVMHAIRLSIVNFTWWFLFFNLSGMVSGYLWYCHQVGNTIYSCVIVGGAIARTIELVTSAVWKFKGESPLIGRTQVVEHGIHLSDRTQYMMEKIRQL